MNVSQSEDHDESQKHGKRWSAKWSFVIPVTIVVYLLTLNPPLAAVIPYLRAGGPAVRTAFWLKHTDSWKSRGRAAFYYHMAMGGFLAGTMGVAVLTVGTVINELQQQPPQLEPMIIALIVILAGGGVSFVCGWIGTYIAAKNGVKIFVRSRLYFDCQGDFSQIARMPDPRLPVNPANYVLAVSLSFPALAFFFVLSLFLIPTVQQNNIGMRLIDYLMFAWIATLPLLGIACVAFTIYLSRKIVARSPHECWGASPPDNDPALSSGKVMLRL